MKKISFKTKATLFFISGIVILLSILIGNVLIRNYRITNELTAIAESHGLKNIKISIGSKIPDYDFYNVTVESSNLESLSYSQMYSLADDMHADDAFVSEYICNGNSYEIYPSTRGIYKNKIKKIADKTIESVISCRIVPTIIALTIIELYSVLRATNRNT